MGYSVLVDAVEGCTTKIVLAGKGGQVYEGDYGR